MPANGLRLRLRPPSSGVLAVAAGVLAVGALLYLAARETSLFAVRELDVSGAPPAVRRAVEQAARPALGESLVALDQDELRRRLAALPAVKALTIDRSFPHTLRISVVPERPLAVVRQGDDAWIVSERGRVIREVEKGSSPRRPQISAGEQARLSLGEIVEEDGVRLALDALRRVPDAFPMRIESARADEHEVTFVLAGGAELRLGARESLGLKLAVAGRVLRTISSAERQELGYLDVTVPERPVGGDKPQV